MVLMPGWALPRSRAHPGPDPAPLLLPLPGESPQSARGGPAPSTCRSARQSCASTERGRIADFAPLQCDCLLVVCHWGGASRLSPLPHLLRNKDIFLSSILRAPTFSHYSLRQTGVGCSARGWALRGDTQRPRSAPPAPRIIALVLSQTPQRLGARSRGHSRDGSRDFHKEQTFSLSRVSAEHHVSKCSIYVRL